MCRRCDVSWCENNDHYKCGNKQKLTYFKVPNERCEEWVKILDCNKFRENAAICERHFSDDQIKSYIDMCDKSGRLVQRVSNSIGFISSKNLFFRMYFKKQFFFVLAVKIFFFL